MKKEDPMDSDRSLEKMNRRKSLKKIGAVSAFIVPTVMTFNAKELKCQASGAGNGFTMPQGYDCPQPD